MADEKKDTEEISDDLNFKNKDELISYLKSLKKDQDDMRKLISDKQHESDDQKEDEEDDESESKQDKSESKQDKSDDLDDLDKFFGFRD